MVGSRLSAIMVGSICGSLMLYAGCSSNKRPGSGGNEISAKGKYLSELGGCVDCHSPKVFTNGQLQVDYTRLFSGHPDDAGIPEVDLEQIASEGIILSNRHFTAHVGQWGAVFSRNLTPDNETGIGTWTEDEFVNAVRSKHNAPIMPRFQALSDRELGDIYAYLMTMPAIENKVPPAMTFDQLKDYLKK